MKKSLLLFAMDFVAAVVIFVFVWVFNYALPQNGVRTQPFVGTAYSSVAEQIQSNANASGTNTNGGSESADLASTGTSENGNYTISSFQDKLKNIVQDIQNSQKSSDLKTTNVKLDNKDWRQKFADKFSKEVISTPTMYSSPNVSIKLTYNQYDSGSLDQSDSGKHTKYGTSISYTLADIYVGDITCLQTAFAKDTYGVGYSEKLSDMSAQMKSILAVNGDSYSNNRHKDNGTIIRNGTIYRNAKSGEETCVLNWDGTMDIYQPGILDEQTLIDRGAYQSWIFGPSLLDSSGKAKTSFWTWDYIRQSHPRTAIGYFEPGHYCLLVVDGRQPSSRGMFLDEMAKVFENLGCKAAYNLDGGHCSFMTFKDQVVSHPYKPEHEVTDGIFITEGLL